MSAAPTNPLLLPIVQGDVNLGATPTVGAYLAEILCALLDETSDFSAKRPLGNSDWDGNIEDALLDGISVNHLDISAEWSTLKDAVTAALTKGVTV